MSSAKPTPDSAYNAAGTAFQAGRIAEARDILIPWVEAGVPDGDSTVCWDLSCAGQGIQPGPKPPWPAPAPWPPSSWSIYWPRGIR